MKPNWRVLFTSLIPEWMQASKTPGTVVSLLQAGSPPEHLCFGITSQESDQQVLCPPDADAHHLSLNWWETMLTPQVSSGPDMAWGLGWGLARINEQTLAWQWGDNGGYKHIAVISPAMQQGIIVLTNNQQGFQVWKNILANSLDPQGKISAWLDSMD